MIETITNENFLEGLAIGEARGLAVGVNKGKVEGKAEGKAEIARNMKQKGYSVKDIADLTGLSSAEIKQLE